MLSRFHGRKVLWGALLGMGFLVHPSFIAAFDDHVIGDLPPNESYRDVHGALSSTLFDADHAMRSPPALQRQILSNAAQIHQVTVEDSAPLVREPFRPQLPRPSPPPPPPPPPPITIPFVDGAGTTYAFQMPEISLLKSFMQVLPTEDLNGITEIQSEQFQSIEMLDSLQSGVVSLYLPPVSNRATDPLYPSLIYYLSEAIGENTYLNVLTPKQQQEWTALTNSAQQGADPQQEFGQFYSLWTSNSYSLLQDALTNANAPTTSTPTPEEALFIASLFLQSPSQNNCGFSGRISVCIATLKAYPGNQQTDPISPLPPISISVQGNTFAGTGFDSTLSIGNYTFRVSNNTLVSWSSGLGVFTLLNPAVPLPRIWLDRLSAVSSSVKGS